MTPEEILKIYDELGRPSAAKFGRALRKRGLRVSDADVQRTIVGLQSERQVVAPPPKYDGKIFSLGLDDKWVADVMVLPAESSIKYWLLVQDVVSRYLWAKPMLSQAGVEAPMRAVMRARRPAMLFTDADTAFTSNAFKAAMAELGVDARVKTGRNDIATVDRAMGLVQEAIVCLRSSTGVPDWAAHVQRAVKAFNRNDLQYLMNSAPADVKEGSELELLLQRKNYQYLQHNQRLLARRTNRLTDKGFFRAYLGKPRAGLGRRAGGNRYSPEMQQVARIDKELVFDAEAGGIPSRRSCPWTPRARAWS